MTKTYPASRNVNFIRSAASAILLTIGCQYFAVAQLSAQSTPQSNEISADIKNLLEFYEKKIYFTENKGQWSPEAIFRADFPLGQAIATTEGMMVGTFDPTGMAARHAQGIRQEQAQHDGMPFNEEWVNVKGHGWMLNFVDHSPSMSIESKMKHKDVFNYLSGDASSSKTDVANYQEIWYKNVYDNVDVRYYPSATGSLEYDMICKPGFNKDNIVLQFDGISKVTKKNDGSLVLQTSVGEMTLPAPVAYQKINGEKKSVKSQYVVTGSNTVKFEVGAFDAAQTLIIDPIALRWATWINSGSTGDNHGHCIWVDGSDGAIYVVARVQGTTNNITVGAMNTSSGGSLETIIGKYYQPANIGGAGTRSWQTYIGGSGDDNPYAMEQGPDGNLYITGQTGSTNFPLIKGTDFTGGGTSLNNASQSGDDIFVMKINQAGNSMKAAVIGGDGTDNSYDLRLTSAGDIVVCGNTTSDNLNTLYPGTSTTSSNGTDVFIFKINQDLSSIIWMRNLGGSGTDQAMIMQMNKANGDIYVGGSTTSNNFPVSNAREGSRTGSTRNGFLQKLKSTGTTAWSTYYNASSSAATSILCMEFNTNKDKLYFGGITSGLNANNLSSAVSGHAFPDVTYNSGTNDFFAASIDTAHTAVTGTYIGGSLNEVNMMGLNVDLNNDVYIFGYTNSTNFPVSPSAFQSTNKGSNDKVFLKLSSTFDSLLASTYYGGVDDDYDPVGERGIKFSDCRIYTIVTARSLDIPLTQGAVTTTRSSANTVYEPGLVVWANPPDLSNNTLTGNQEVCAGGAPVNITGSSPSYNLPTITRNGTTSAYPSLGVSITYQWQSSTDSVNWTNIAGATGQNLSSGQAGPLFTKTFYRRVIGGDACVIEGSTDQIIVVKVIKITGTVTNATCNGAATGSIAAVATNGTPPYSYSWSNGATTATASNLAAGNYTLTVTDGSGCSNTATYTVTEPNILSATCTAGGTYCVNNGGSISTSITGGTTPYTYAWSNGATTSSISGLGAGTYSVLVTDAKGCTTSCSVTLGVPVATCSKTDVLCRNGNSGTASVSVSGGASPYTYSWSNGATTASINGLTAGTYTVTVTAANGCTATCSATVGQPANALTATCSKTDVSCFGGTNGSVSVVASGGTAPYTYSWTGGGTTATVNGKSAGTYTVTVTDANNCTTTCSATVGQPAGALSATCSKTDVLCFGGSTGSVSVVASGGTAPYTYSWTGGGTTATVNGKSAGTYTVTVTDAKGCTTTCSATVGQPSGALSATCNKTDVLCFGGSTGSVSVVASGGTAPYTYSWTGGGTTATVNGKSAGTYTVTVTDANGCTTTCSSTVGQPSGALSATCNKTDVSCFGGATGSVSVVASGGTAPYTYSWTGGGTTATVNGKSAGTYTVTVTDANGCTTTCSSTVGQPAAALSASCNKTDALCYGSSTGSVSVTASGGTAPYTYSWTGGGTTATVNNRAAGTYTVTVTDAKGCTTTCSATVGQPAASVTVTCNKTDALCFGTATGSVSVTAQGGTQPYTYSWTGGGATATVNGKAAGTYTVTVTDANGCSNTCSATVGQPAAALSATCNKTDALCFGTATGSVSVTASGGTAPYTYSWTGGGATATVNGKAAGTYTVTVTDANGCTTTCSATVGQPAAALSASCNKTDALCFGGSTGSVSVTASGGTAPYTYSWTGGGTTATVNGKTAGTYTVTVTDANGCTTTCSATVGQPAAALSATCNKTDVLCFGGNTGSVSVTASGGTAPYTYSWTGGGTTATVTGKSAGTYTVTVTDANGCTTTCSSTVGQPAAALSGNVTATVATCTQSNSTATPHISGGTQPYTYLWSNGQTTATATGYAAGNYSVVVTDANGCTFTANFTVAKTNCPPVAVDDYRTTPEDVPVTVTVVSNDTDVDGNIDPSTVTLLSQPTNGTAVVNPDGTVTYTPFSHYVGPDQFNYQVCDDGTPLPIQCDQATVFITVVSTPTVIVDTIPEDSLITLCLNNYVNLQGGISSISVCGMPSNGTFTINGICATYTPTANWNGTDNMCIISCNANNVCDTTPIIIVVIPVNDPPIAVDDFETTEEDVPVTVTVVTNDTDIDGNIDPNTVAVVVPPSNGTAVVNPDGTVTYTPASHYVGYDHFVYNVCDDGTPLPALCDTASVFITVTGVPTIIIDSIPEDSLITLCLNDYVNIQGGISGISVCGMPQNGTFTLNGLCATYTPTANWNGTDTMCVISCNANNVCDTTPIIIIVIPVNDPPIANDDFETTQEDVPVTVTVVTNDTDIDGNIDPNTVAVVQQPSNGTVVVNPDGTITYTPDSHYVGYDHFVYNVCDDGTPLPALCDTASVFITVTGVPTIIIDSIPEDSLITLCLNDYVNIQGGISGISVCGMPQNGTFTLNGLCATYTPTANWNGTDTMCVISCNANNVCDTTPIIIIVIPVNDPPIAVDDYGVTQEDVPVTVTVVLNDTDIDGNIDPNTVAVVQQPSNGTVVVNPDGTITYTPDSHYVGYDHFVYNVCDDGTPLPALCDTASVFITVTGVPTIIIDSIPEDSLITLCLDDYVSLQGGISSVSVCGMPQNGTFTINGLCATYTPTANWNGTDTMCVISCNANNVCDTTPIIIIVIPVNDPPIAVDDSLTTNEDTPGTVVVVTNDTDIDGNIDPSTVTIITPPTHGTAVVNPDGSVTYTPDSHYYGPDSLVYQVCDDGTPLPALCDQATVYINVIPVNLPPLAIDDINNTLINTPVSGNVLTNDTDPDGDAITVTGVVTPPASGTVTLNPDGSYTYTPNTGFTGEDHFSYSVCDNGVPGPLCDTATVYITVIPVTVDNNPPVANPDNAVTLINVPVGGNVLVNDGDPDGDNIILNTTPISNPSNGSVVLNPDGSYIYTPNTNFIGVDVFVYEICDDGVPSLCDQTTVTIHVLDNPGPDNDPPFAADDAYLTPENVPVSGNVLTNDFDPNGDPITINTTPVVGTVNGTVVINPDGSFTYTPNADYIGPDQFVYSICDNGGLSGVVLCAQGTAYITVYPVNLPPVAVDDINNTLINTPVSGNVLTNDFDQDGDNIAVTVNTNPSNGSVVVNPDGSYTYTPNTGYTGEDTFTYTICDDGNPGPMCDVATVTIHVIPVTTDNNPPIANPDNAVTLVNIPVGGNVLVNDADPDGDNIIPNTTPISNPSNGSVVVNPDGSYIYTPNTDFVGVDVFVYEICDDGVPSLCDQTTVTITVLDDTDPDNDPPFAADDAYLTPENVPVSGNVLTNDFDPNGDPITINTTPVVGTVNGTVVINPDGSFTYTPNTDYIGPDQFVYSICDNGGLSGVVLCAQGTAYITVYPANLPPVAVDDINNTLVNTPVSGNVLTNDFDQDGDNIAVTVNTNPSNGSVVVNPDGSYTYTPNTGYTGQDTFTYTICDDGNPGPLCDVATVTIHIIEVTSDNNPPIANPDNAVTLINVPVGGNVLVNDGDPDGDNIILNTTPISNPSNGSVVLNPDGSYIYTPNTDFVGVDVFVYEICDDGVPSLCDQTTVTITVLDNPNGPDNDPPFAADDAYLTPVNTPVSGNVLTNDFDPNGDPITINTTPVTGPQHGTVVINSDGTFTYTPNTGYIGPDQYVYSICDNGGLSGVVLCAQGTVYITVYPTMDITLDPTDASCYGYSDGSVDLTVLNGVAPYTYAWSNGATTEDLTSVPAGTYTVTVSDAFGLVVSGTVTVGEPAQVTVSIDPSGPTTFCQGGSVTLTATSSFTGTYLWSNGATTQSINVSDPGVYTVTLTDVNGCSGTSSSVEVFVNPNPTPTVTASGPTTFCNGGNVVLTSSPASTYVWAPGGELTQSITVTASGNYSVWVMDANGCEGTSAPVFVTVNSNPAPIVSASGPTTFCAGGNVTLTATGSNNIASYLWAPNGETTASIVVDASGTYSVTVTDVNGCVGTSNPVTVTVNPNPTPIVDANGPTTFCAGGSVVLSSSPAASYVWSPNGETTQSITVTATGSYSVAVLDANGCSGVSAAVNVTVNPNPTPVVTPGGPTTFCEGGSVTLTSSAADMYVWAPGGETTQAITVTATGVYSVWVMDANGCEGTSAGVPVTINSNPTPVVDADGPTTFCQGESVMLTSSSATGNLWSPTGDITQSIVVESAGDYFVTVTDVNGCVGVSDTVTVVVNANPTPTVTPDGPTTFCDGGSVTLTASAANGYLWAPNGETTQAITVSSSGSYYVTVFDANGCRGNSAPIVVVENSNPTPVITPGGPTTFCAGGSVTLTSSAAAGYLWSPNGETTQSITVTATGDYAVTVTDANGCSGASAPVHVEVSAPLVVTITTSGPTEICEGQSVTLTANATNAATYQWYQNGAAIAGATGASITVSDFADYHVVVTDQNGCTGNSQIVLVKVGEIPNAYAGLDQFVCPGSSVTLTATGGANFLWSNGETTQSIVVSPSQATDYTVTVTNPFCGLADMDTVNVDIATLPVAAIHASDNPSLGNPVNFTDVSGDNSIVSWFWNFGDGTNAMTQNAHHTYDEEGNFTVVLTVENQYGCSDTDSVVVEVQQIILIPNIITPNGDGINDGLGVKNNGVDDYGITIFNRWGQIVYERESREITWDGKTNSGVALEAGTYYYILIVKNTGSLGNFEQTGFITLVR